MRTSQAESRWSVLQKDIIAGLINAVVSVPDGLASAALAGVNPVYGLYTSIAAPISGSLLVSAQLMQIATTSASALAAAQAIQSYPEEQREPGVVLAGCAGGRIPGYLRVVAAGAADSVRLPRGHDRFLDRGGRCADPGPARPPGRLQPPGWKRGGAVRRPAGRTRGNSTCPRS